MRAQTSSAEFKHPAIRRAEPPYAPRAGAALGRWRLAEPLAQGGTAQVWRGIDRRGAAVALKLSRHGHGEALRAEHAVLSAVAHPHVVRPIEIVEVDGRPLALVLELVEGGDLVPLLGAPQRHWVAALRGVVAAVAHLHESGVAHCDLKARNVLLAADGGARLIDFASAGDVDAARDSRRGTTAAHRPARERATGREIDVFALAVLAYELLTGVLPFGIDGRRSRHDSAAPWANDTPTAAPLMDVVRRLLAADGTVSRGLSSLADVIESAAAEADE